MNRELIIKKCQNCGAMVNVLKDCNCSGCKIQCCGEPMPVMEPNSTDAAIEKHVPNVEVIDDKIKVTVNHVMESDHYIEWIAMITETSEFFVHLQPGKIAEVIFDYQNPAKIYAFCNKHGLWVTDIK